MTRDLSVSPYSLGVPQPLWTGSAAATWTPLRGQVSVAEEVAVDVDLRLVAGVEVHRGGIERIGSGRSADETVVPLANTPLWRTGRDEAYTGVGPALGFSARAWLGPMAALDLDVRDAWYRGPASETALSFDGAARPAPETVWRDQATVSLAVTVTEPRRRTAVLAAN